MTTVKTANFQPLGWQCEELAPTATSYWRFPHRDEVWRYEDLILQAIVCARLLSERGVGFGKGVALAMDNGADLVVALLAIWRLDAVAVPLQLGAGPGWNPGDQLAVVDRAADLSGLIYDTLAPEQAIRGWADDTRKAAWQADCLTRSNGSIVGYGMAENTPGATRTPPGPVRRIRITIDDQGQVHPFQQGNLRALELVSVGRPLPDCRLGIRGECGRALPERQLGEIWLKGPCVSPGYFLDAETTAKHFQRGWHKSFDLGFVDGGELYVLCRQGDLVKIGGASLVPDDVEQFIEDHCTLVDPGGSCLLGSVNADDVTVAKLLIEVELGRQDRVDGEWQRRLRRELAVRFGLWGLSILIVPEGTIQRTGNGKKRRKAIADRFLRGEVATLMPNGLKPGSIQSVEDDAMPA